MIFGMASSIPASSCSRFTHCPTGQLCAEVNLCSKANRSLSTDDELGFYAPSDIRILKLQAQMAKHHGLYGFCFDLGTGKDDATSSLPLDLFLVNEDVDFRFCVQAELQSEDIPESLVASLVRAMSDARFICIQGRPVILVTVLEEKQDVATALRNLRCCLADQGVGNPFLISRWAPTGEERPCQTCTMLCLISPVLRYPGRQVIFCRWIRMGSM